MVGKTEEELTEDNVPYEVGRAQYREIARGQIIGDDSGLLKLLFHAGTRRASGSPTSSARALASSFTSGRPCSHSVVRWTTSWTPCSTIRHSQSATRRPRWTESTASTPSHSSRRPSEREPPTEDST